MNNPLIYAILFAVAGATGMAIANRKANRQVSRQRWLKYFIYVLITGIILTSLYFNFFFTIALVIALLCFTELIKNNLVAYQRIPIQVVTSILIFIVIATGFLLYAREFKWPFLLFIYFQVFIFDGFCQVTGQIWGKRALAPSVSPAKTIEGFIGGWLFCILAAMLVSGWLGISLSIAILAGVVTGFASFCGDMLASFYKRKLRIKDYSNWLPGQGGFLDRFDSLLFTGMIYYITGILIFKDRFSLFINVIM